MPDRGVEKHVPVSPGWEGAVPRIGPGRIVIITASVGAGHDGAAREWARRLRDQGFDVDVHDLLALLPAWVAGILRDAYRSALYRAPWVWSVVYHLTRTRPAVRLIDIALARYRRRLCAVLSDQQLVVSTYPLASRMLGMMRRRAELACPAATFITDFSVVPLWVADGVDAHFVVHEEAAAQAAALGARRVEITGPLVPERFRMTSDRGRRAARSAFGLPVEGSFALVVAGSWGVGDVERTAQEIEAAGRARAVVACGHNTELRNRLTRSGVGIPLAWVASMDELLRAVDVLVENAGGLSSLEAMASGVPVVTYRAIPGHGQANATALNRAGVSIWVRHVDELAGVLDMIFDTGVGTRLAEQGLGVFTNDPTKPALDLAATARSPR
jgi:processive 1,2-diacylglycerol beta-glucosyltransferase